MQPTRDTLMISAILLIFLAIIPAHIARKKGKNFFVWYFYGYWLFIVALIHALLLPVPQKTEHFDQAQEMEEDNYQDIVVTSSRIGDSYISSPLDALSYQVIRNKNTRKLICKLNLFASKPVQRLDIKLELYNGQKEAVGTAVFQDHIFADVLELDISEYPETVTVTVDYDNVLLDDGSLWASTGEKVTYEVEMIDSFHLEEIKRLTNKYAFCYPMQKDQYWVCSCSKANGGEHCVLCGMNREELFSVLSSSKIHQMKNEEKVRKNLESFHASQTEKLLAGEE